MQIFKTITAIALASVAYAESTTLYFATAPDVVHVGHPFRITYRAPEMSKPVKIILRKGDSRDTTTVATLTDNATGGTYSWTPSSSLASGSDYALEITQGDQINYTGEFSISGGSAASSSATSRSAMRAITPMPVPTMTVAPSSMATIPMSRNVSFTTPTPTASPTRMPGGGSGGSGGSGSSNNAGMTLPGSLALIIGAFAAFACLV